ncbi:Lnb N-terminal periplasmic domain-containing protein [Flavobacterium sp. GNP001]
MQKFSIYKSIIFFLIGIFSSAFYAQPLSLSPQSKVSVLTCGTGNESYSLFGHTAVRVQDATTGFDAVYNYGAFDFKTPNFVMKFAKGDLQYFAVAHSYTDFIAQYQYEQRAVYEQELVLPLDAKQRLFEQLQHDITSADSHYTYKFIDKNCTTMVVDAINKAVGINLITKKEATDNSYRDVLLPYFDGHFYEKLGTSIIFGSKVDQAANRIFLPFDLLESLKKVQFNKSPLAKETVTVLPYNQPTPFSWWNNPYSYILILFTIVGLNRKGLSIFFMTILGLIGVLFATAWNFSLHAELANNYNLLVFNPILLLLLLAYVMKNKKIICYLATMNLIALGVYTAYCLNKPHLILVLPIVLTSAALSVRMLIQNKKPIPIII